MSIIQKVKDIFTKVTPDHNLTDESLNEIETAYRESSRFIQFASHIKEMQWLYMGGDVWTATFGYYTLTAMLTDQGWDVDAKIWEESPKRR